jgi:hypothetical protein
MRALVMYESLWGNTEKIARAIAHELEPEMDVDVVDSDRAPSELDCYDLVVVGGPTHAFSMSRPATREGALQKNGAPHAPQRGLREWLDDLKPIAIPIPAAVFDTRVESPRLPGSAAKAARHELRSRGFDTARKAESFHVHGYEGPLVDGEVERAAMWARALTHPLTV